MKISIPTNNLNLKDIGIKTVSYLFLFSYSNTFEIKLVIFNLLYKKKYYYCLIFIFI